MVLRLCSKQGCVGKFAGCRPGDDAEIAVHDALVGGVFVATSLATLGAFGAGFVVPGAVVACAVSGLMVASTVTGWCPVHHALAIVGMNGGKIRPGHDDGELKLHDGTVGVLQGTIGIVGVCGAGATPFLFGVFAAAHVGLLVGLLMVSSGFTGYCPVHHLFSLHETKCETKKVE